MLVKSGEWEPHTIIEHQHLVLASKLNSNHIRCHRTALSHSHSFPVFVCPATFFFSFNFITLPFADSPLPIFFFFFQIPSYFSLTWLFNPYSITNLCLPHQLQKLCLCSLLFFFNSFPENNSLFLPL